MQCDRKLYEHCLALAALSVGLVKREQGGCSVSNSLMKNYLQEPHSLVSLILHIDSFSLAI